MERDLFNMSNLAPIILFVYNRPEHTRKTVEALAANSLAKDSDLFIFVDGSKNESARPAVESVRKYVELIRGGGGFKSVTITAHDKNQGLANSVIAGITSVLNSHDRAIIVEDDIVTSPYFLNFMNDALEMYKDDLQVCTIDAYHKDFKFDPETMPPTFFYPFYDIWGWGTWARAWKDFNPDAAYLLAALQEKNLIYSFDLDSNNPVYSKMLEAQRDGKIDSWAVRWYATNFLLGRLSLHTGISYTKNIGFDGSGVHYTKKIYWLPEKEIAKSYAPLKRIPVEINHKVFEVFKAADRKEKAPRSLPYRAVRKLYRIIKSFFVRY